MNFGELIVNSGFSVERDVACSVRERVTLRSYTGPTQLNTDNRRIRVIGFYQQRSRRFLRGGVSPEEKHSIEFKYRPYTFCILLGLSFLLIILFCSLLFVG